MDFLTLIGGACVVYFLFILTTSLYFAFTVYISPAPVDYSKYGKWSVITGGTDGIGKAIAFQLAAQGQNIILISRSEEKLEKVSEEIRSKHQVLVKHLKIDFTDDETIYHEIRVFLQNTDIGVLVNNVGIVNDPCLFLDQHDLSKRIRDITRVNITAMLKMTQIVLPGMVSKHRGLILNISSATALIPLYSLYGATKVFMSYFSENLAHEYKDKGITVQSVLSCFVRTNMTAGIPIKNKLLMPDPDEFAAAVLAAADKGISISGCWQHAVQVWFLTRLPLTVIPFVFRNFFGVENVFQKKKE